MDIWHRRLGHINEKYVRIICPFIPKYLTLSLCPYCIVSKITTKPLHKTKIPLPKQSKQKGSKKKSNHHKSTTLTSTQITNISTYNSYKPGEYISVDLKHMPLSIDNELYLCTFTCTSTRLAELTTLTSRTGNDFLQNYTAYCKYIRNKTGKYPKYTYSDNGTEFVNKQTRAYNKSKGITFLTTAPHSSLQNSISERINRTIGEGSLALLVCANLPTSFWKYSSLAFNFVKNRSPHKSLNYSNPIASWNIFMTHRSTIDLYDIRIFGCEAWVLIETTLKNHPKAVRCIYLGPCVTQKGSYFYNLHTKKISVSRNFVINEQQYPGRLLFPNIYDKYLAPTPVVTNLTTPATPTSTSATPATIIPPCPHHHFSFDSDIVVSNENVESKSDDKSVKNEDIKLEHKHDDVETNEHFIDVPISQISIFDRSTNSKVGPADIPSLSMPPLEPPTPLPSSHPPSSPVQPPEQKFVTTDDPIPEELYQFDSIIGKRKTKFGKTKGSKWRFGGGTWDYQVLWSNKETSFEPETTLRGYAADAIKDYELSLAGPPPAEPSFPPESSNPEVVSGAEIESPSHPNSTSSTFINLACFVYLPFFCFLAKVLPFPRDTSWKNVKVPLNRQEMLRSPEREKWLQSERVELDQCIEKKTWKRVPKKPPKKPISCRWVYKLKPPTTLQPEPVFKARLVAHGYKQQAEIDYSSTFAQVATLKAFRILMWISVIFGYRATQMDVKNAFLAGKLDKEIYMTAPPGYESEVGTVLLLKSLYGLKQAPRIWYNTLVKEFHKLGFKEIVSDSCVFSHHTHKCYILVFVDDIIVYTKNETFRTTVEQGLKATFDIKLLGTLRHFIGLHIDTDKHGNVHIHQHDYIQKLKDTFSSYFTGNVSYSTPYDSNVKFSKTQQPTTSKEQTNMKSYPYRQLIGSLLYLLGTRPEIYFIIITLSKYVTNPGYIHWLAALHVLFYVCNTSLFGLLIRVGQKFQLSVYVDSDHAGNVDDRKSISGYIIYLGTTPIVWRSRQQKGKPAESSCEAEYISLSSCINEVVWIIAFLSELGFRLPTPVPIFCDNKSAKDLAYNPVNHERTKHIDIRYHRIREFILDGTVIVHHVRTENNPADIFTKTVLSSVFKFLLPRIYGKFD